VSHSIDRINATSLSVTPDAKEVTSGWSPDRAGMFFLVSLITALRTEELTAKAASKIMRTVSFAMTATSRLCCLARCKASSFVSRDADGSIASVSKR